jgi:hypothetical protein
MLALPDQQLRTPDPIYASNIIRENVAIDAAVTRPEEKQ